MLLPVSGLAPFNSFITSQIDRSAVFKDRLQLIHSLSGPEAAATTAKLVSEGPSAVKRLLLLDPGFGGKNPTEDQANYSVGLLIIKRAGRPDVKQLVSLLGYKDYQAIARGWLADLGPEAVPELIDALSSFSGFPKWFCMIDLALLASGSRDAELVDSVSSALIRQFKSSAKSDRLTASDMFEIIHTQDVLPMLYVASRNENPLVRASAARAMAKIPSDTSVPPLTSLLKDTDSDVAIAAANALRPIHLTSQSEKIVSARLLEATKSPSVKLRSAALLAGFYQSLPWVSLRSKKLLRCKNAELRKTAALICELVKSRPK